MGSNKAGFVPPNKKIKMLNSSPNADMLKETFNFNNWKLYDQKKGD